MAAAFRSMLRLRLLCCVQRMPYRACSLDIRYGISGLPAFAVFRNGTIEGRIVGPRCAVHLLFWDHQCALT